MIFLILFFFVGAAIGTQLNHAIYRFANNYRPISPWMNRFPKWTESYPEWRKRYEKASARNWFDYIPVLGWTSMNRDEKVHGSLFWLRPLLIEIGFGAALAWLYQFHVEHQALVPDSIELANRTTAGWHWFVAHAVLLGLLVVATFIDFDEFTIPDEVTVWGMHFFLVYAAITPQIFLPDITQAKTAEPMNFASPTQWPAWTSSGNGLLIAIACYWFWCFALIPKTITFRKGIGQFLPLLFASILRPKRKTTPALQVKNRTMFPTTKLMFVLGVIFPVLLAVFWFSVTDVHRISILTAILGMTFGLSMIWAIRIVGKLALGMEAMGFGDVTLMAMVGSIVGWQSCLPILAISAFVALGVTLPIYLVKQDKALPYGPYLSIGTIIVILFWPQVWEGYFKGILLLFGIQNVFLVLACMTIPLFLLLHIVRFFKNVIFGVQE